MMKMIIISVSYKYANAMIDNKWVNKSNGYDGSFDPFFEIIGLKIYKTSLLITMHTYKLYYT